ncbi:hypothetical protein K469DRAFT_332932 [Zopfia rhizophila CBS 207.26]|uniref:Fungal N-terminal domain-containing protein n=1 Tax=Zopfia rhizophila CBS 207.26 TaxID=1314779 RepID=A0A6A6DH13_9PEZI|nr:hypothetical protein K469DRAFT_332932 [Zopfia rhizophila CBS 207.26]
MEALSVAASAVQLAAYSASIITFIGKLFKSLRNLPQQYHQYEVQLLLLIHITFNIENNPALQTKDIKVHLEATTKEVAALQSLLCRPKIAFARSSVVRRLWDTIEGFEQQVSSRLERLRQMTIVLQISLESENTRQVYCIRQGVNRLNTLFAISGVGDQGAARAMDNSDVSRQTHLSVHLADKGAKDRFPIGERCRLHAR